MEDLFVPLGGKERKRSKDESAPAGDDLINYTVGLVSASEYKTIKENLEILKLEKLRKESESPSPSKNKQVKKKRIFSFTDEEPVKVPAGISKDPTACTSFLKDSKREKELLEERERLTKLFYQNKNREKKELIEIFYSYWDGNDHFRTISVPKETTVGEFINKCIKQLTADFRELKSASSNTMIYVKQDTIIPNDMSFYDIINSKLRGKTGPLYDTPSDDSSANDKLNAGKILDKRWYERNKHAFPACKWERYNPHKLAFKTQVVETFK